MLGPDSIPWPDNGEIDIMEQAGSAPSTISGTIHTGASAGTYGSGGETTVSDACDAFHTYHATWTEDRIDIGVDGSTYFTYENDGGGPDTWPFDTPHYLLVNLAIGGEMGGYVDPSTLPAKFVIDYVRVYQKQ